MITQSQSGIVKPIDRLSLNTFSISPIPKNSFISLKDPQWRYAMYGEYNVLVKNETWILVPSPMGVNMVCSMWLFKHKFYADGTLSRYKAWLVANGSSQQLASSTTLLQQIISSLHSEFDLTISEHLIIFLVYLHFVTPQESKLGPEGVSVQDPTLYCSLAGGLPYLTFTRPDLSYVVQQIYLYIHDPREPYFTALKRILRYVRGTIDFGLHVYTSATTFLVGYMDADWAGFPSTRRSTSGYYVFLGDLYYHGHPSLRNLLRELHSPLSYAILVYYVNVSAISMFVNPVQHQRTKHVEIDIHFVCDMVTARQIERLGFGVHISIHGINLYTNSSEEAANPISWNYVDIESKLGPDGDHFRVPTLYRSLGGPLHDNLLSCSAKRQVTLSRSSDESEYRGVANLDVETEWIRNVLRELHALLFTTILVYCDNASVMYMSGNPVQHQHTKHIEIDYILSMTL
nr:ribonuclease H-like domain-containing protein [Tanacetum cinerariifolium]